MTRCPACSTARPLTGSSVAAEIGAAASTDADACGSSGRQPALDHFDAPRAGGVITGAAGTPSHEGDALDRMEARATLTRAGGVAVVICGILVPAAHPSGATFFCGLLAVICGPVCVWAAARWRQVLLQARTSLETAPSEFRLDRRFRRSRVDPGWIATLWDANGRPVARFSTRWQQSVPLILSASGLPVCVYGAPTTNAVVVVSCRAGVLVGRVAREYGTEPGDASLLAKLWVKYLKALAQRQASRRAR